MKAALLCLCLLQFPAPAAAEQRIRVAIVRGSPALKLKTSAKISVTEVKTGAKFSLAENASYEIRSEGGAIVAGDRRLTSPIQLLSGSGGERLRLGGRLYDGDIILRATEGGRLDIVESLSIEGYLCGVLAGEMGAEWPQEALKAQAVASRTYALRQLKPDKDYDITDGVEMQVYKGAAAADPRIKQAVLETAGEVLRYKNKLITAFFHACCGGHTSSVGAAWGEEISKPLSGVRDPFCAGSRHTLWELYISSRDLLAYLQKQGSAAIKLKAIKVHKKDRAGRALTVRFSTDQGSKTVQAKEMRKHFGSFEFRSTLLSSITPVRSGYQFAGRGWGHGVGMCQEGAKAMALGGRGYRKILRHYYPGASIEDY